MHASVSARSRRFCNEKLDFSEAASAQHCCHSPAAATIWFANFPGGVALSCCRKRLLSEALFDARPTGPACDPLPPLPLFFPPVFPPPFPPPLLPEFEAPTCVYRQDAPRVHWPFCQSKQIPFPRPVPPFGMPTCPDLWSSQNRTRYCAHAASAAAWKGRE